MSELSAFLLARLAEERIVAREAVHDPWRVGHLSSCDWWGDMPGYCTCDAVARLLVDCETKRRIVAAVVAMGENEHAMQGYADEVLRLLGLPYESHPNYDEGWKP